MITRRKFQKKTCKYEDKKDIINFEHRGDTALCKQVRKGQTQTEIRNNSNVLKKICDRCY